MTSVVRELNAPRYPVEGRVLIEGRPARGVELTLHRLPLNSTSAPIASAWSNAEGRFSVHSLGIAAGAPVGEYVVTARWRRPEVSGESLHPGVNELDGKYADPARTPLRVLVGPGVNDIPPWKLHKCRCELPLGSVTRN